MNKSVVLGMAMALGVTASAYAANPFSDVPANSWAYDAVNKLAAEGIICLLYTSPSPRDCS